LSKKALAVGIVFLFIFSVGNSFVVGYDAELDENLSEGNCLTECLNEHEEPTHQICGKNYGSTAVMENSAKCRLFKQENNIDSVMDDLLEFYRSFDPYFRLMETTGDQDDGEHDGYAKATYDDVENSTICGYIVDNTTEGSIEGARVIVFWSGNRGIDVNYTYSDSLGFYSINIEINFPFIVARASGYFSEFISISNSEESETLWFNVSLDPGAPHENSVICGYITDNVIDDPIDGADIIQVDHDASMYYDWNYTCTNSSGFYSVNIAAGDIFLYSDADGYYGNSVTKYDISESETLWINLSLVPLPLENSTVCGYITDNVTENPIENAYVGLNWRDGYFYQNYTSTNSSGFYSMNVAAGEIDLYAGADGYFGEHTYDYDIGENETLWINISFYPIPPENSVVCGYVTDETTGDPIEDARVRLSWCDEHEHHDRNCSYTNSSGFYSMNVAAGEFYLYISADRYFSESTEYYNFDIGENETMWVNISLEPYPPENSIVCGFINNSLTGDFIENAYVGLNWRDGYFYQNYTSTNSSGFYSMNVAAGEIDLYAGADGYFGEHTYGYDIGENETLWVNISLYPIPSENSVVCGYVIDEETGDPIEDARIHLDWHDGHGHYYENYTYTNSGFYSMNVAAGEIDLYAGADGYFGEHTYGYDIGENETLWVNISLYPIPSENSVVCGYVTDETTGTPIENARVGLHWNDDQDHNVWDDTYTDSSGFYRMNVAAGEINIDVEADEYLEVHTESYDIGEYESLEINITMQFIINENSVVCGYITDVETDYPIIDAYVSLHWHDDRGHFYWKYTFADSSGFYEMNVASGEVCIHSYAYEYLCKYTEDYEIGEYDTLWVNVPMQREVIEVNIVKPQKALYVANYRVLPLLFKPIIYGSIDIEVDASDDTSFVEFRVDGKIRATDNSEPYTWTWNTRTLLKHGHIIEVVAYGRFGSSATDEITVWKFF